MGKNGDIKVVFKFSNIKNGVSNNKLSFNNFKQLNNYNLTDVHISEFKPKRRQQRSKYHITKHYKNSNGKQRKIHFGENPTKTTTNRLTTWSGSKSLQNIENQKLKKVFKHLIQTHPYFHTSDLKKYFDNGNQIDNRLTQNSQREREKRLEQLFKQGMRQHSRMANSQTQREQSESSTTQQRQRQRPRQKPKKPKTPIKFFTQQQINQLKKKPSEYIRLAQCNRENIRSAVRSLTNMYNIGHNNENLNNRYVPPLHFRDIKEDLFSIARKYEKNKNEYQLIKKYFINRMINKKYPKMSTPKSKSKSTNSPELINN